MKIVFRVDSSIKIGSGHLMRCLTLAEALVAEGCDVVFICRDLEGNLSQIVRDNGFKVILLPGPGKQANSLNWNAHAAWLGVSREQDADDTIAALQEVGEVDWLIIDHYALDKVWQTPFRPFVKNIMVIDDLADRAHDCDLLLDQNLYDELEKRYDNLVPDACIKLLGPHYSILRPEFSIYRKEKHDFSGQVRHIVLFFGGSDADNMTEKALNALKVVNSDLDEVLTADVVVGRSNVHKVHIEEICKNLPWATFHCQVNNMAKLLAGADMSIGAVGVTTWERCCLGVPSLAVSVAENQLEVAKKGGRDGLFFYLGHGSAVSAEMIESSLRTFTSSPENLKSFASRSSEAVDGLGCRRVVDFLTPNIISLRYVDEEDRDNIYQWRVAEETRRHLFNKKIFSLESHCEWFEKSVNDPDRILLIGEISGSPVGVVRFDLLNQDAVVSVYTVPGLSGQGYGKKLVRTATVWARENLHKSSRIIAEILPENKASLRVFESSGYREKSRTYVNNIK